ncbi:olfactory receptor 5AR1-like [Lissotriton helveticus]
MQVGNKTSVREFILLGLSDDPSLQIQLFLVFLFIYILTILGNIFIMALIIVAPQLHTPMYFFLCNLSSVDLCYSSTIVPNMLVNFLSATKEISYNGCAVQLFFFAGFAGSDALLLSVMAYDRYSAICHPLHYQVLMTKRVCIYFVSGTYAACFIAATVHTSVTFRLFFCGPNRISHFYCDLPPLLKLACSDTSLNEWVIFAVAGSMQVGSLLIVLISYVYIVSAILRIRSSQGRLRAFSTCTSHLACVILLYTPMLFMYLRPRSSYLMDQDRVASVFYTVVIPMLNPLIYSLRNKDVKEALGRVIERSCIK